jgi:predicted amidohydrolase
MQLKISLAQMALLSGKPEENFHQAESWIAQAARQGSDLVLLPELWDSGYDLENWRRYAASLDAGHFARLAALARQHQVAVGGSMLELYQQRAYNSFVLFGPDGQLWGRYRKVHLFRLLNEQEWLAAGQELALAQTTWGPIGLSICYDLRFPELFRPYALAGARLVLLVAEWPERRIAHWSALLRARAIENQCFVAAVNKSGVSQDVRLGGRSVIIDPWGETLAEAQADPELISAPIDLRVADIARRHIPALQDRQPQAYQAGVPDGAGDATDEA